MPPKKTPNETEIVLTDEWIYQGIDLENRKLYLDSDIDVGMMGIMCRSLMTMNTVSKEEDIHIIINSEGGSVYDGYSLYDTIRMLECNVITYATGQVMSMGVDIFLAGDVRVAMPSATFMVHTVSQDFGGKHYENKISIDEGDRLLKNTVKLFAERADRCAPGYKSEKQWLKKIESKDFFFDAQEAMSLGFAHEIMKSGGLP